MTKASDNVFPKLIGAEGAAPATPAAGTSIAYVKADGLWYSKDDAGVETLMSSGSGSGIPATLFDAKGDIIAASAADTAARLAAAANGASLITASGESTGLKWRLNNDGASAAPAVTDDSGDGYSIGSRWLDTTNDKEYVATDVSVGAAVWVETTATGGAGASISRIGTTTPGGSTEQFTANRVVSKKITVPGAGIIQSIGIYIQPRSAQASANGLQAGVWDDASAVPTILRHYGKHVANSVVLGPQTGGTFPGYPRWLYLDAGVYVPSAGDYWVGARLVSTAWDIFYAAGGSDRIWGSSTYVTDGDYFTQSDSTLNYSIHAVFVG